MREILFRGKHVLDGRWIEGFYNGVRPDFATMQTKECHRIFSLKSLAYDVDPDTVGQFTDLTDKNGKKIFEGDIVHMNSRKFGLSGHGVVVYRNGGFAIDDRKRNRLYPFMQNGQYNSGEYRVDGNIYDNPELMEGE